MIIRGLNHNLMFVEASEMKLKFQRFKQCKYRTSPHFASFMLELIFEKIKAEISMQSVSVEDAVISKYI